MVINFVNLVALKKIYEGISDFKHHKFYCDSISLQFLLKCLGRDVNRIAGINFVKKIVFNDETDFFLLAEEDSRFSHNNKYVLPDFTLPISHDLVIRIYDVMNEKNINRVFIGVSSPKQNFLADELARKMPDLEIFCFGAAISSQSLPDEIWDKNGMSWLFFLLTKPQRTMVKIFDTLKNFIIFLFSTKHKSWLKNLKFE